MVDEVLEALDPSPGRVVADCTLGFGGHASAILPRILPGGRLIALDVDPIELPKTVERLRARGFPHDALAAHRSNFAGLAKVLAAEGLTTIDGIFADLGLSSMQIDTPERGFSLKVPGPLDMRMNPARGLPASDWIERTTRKALAEALAENADEPHHQALAEALWRAGGSNRPSISPTPSGASWRVCRRTSATSRSAAPFRRSGSR